MLSRGTKVEAPIKAPLSRSPKEDGTKTDGSKAVLMVLVLMILAYNFLGVVYSNMRVQQLGPLCGQHGWEIIDTGLGQSAKCLDTRTGVMYLPPEVFNRR